MTKSTAAFGLIACSYFSIANAQLIDTVAGGWPTGSIFPVSAITVPAYAPSGAVAVDFSGNTYIPDTIHNTIFKRSPSGDLSVFAGNGIAGFAGDGGPASAAMLSSPYSVAMDTSGNLFIADFANQRIRKVDSGGTITTVAGSGHTGFAGDGGPAVTGVLSNPTGIAVDATGNLYITDQANGRIRRVNPAGVINTIAGGGWPTPGIVGGALNFPVVGYGIAVDTSRRLYIASANNNVVLRVDPDNTVRVIAGNGTSGFAGDGGDASGANLQNPTAIAVDAVGNLYIADYGNRRIRKVDATGTITTVAGTGNCTTNSDGSPTGDGGPAIAANLCTAGGIALDPNGNLYVADTNVGRVRRVDSSGVISTFAGASQLAYSGEGGAATSATMMGPTDVAIDASGLVYIADNGDNRILKVDGAGTISTVAGTGVYGFTGDGGPAVAATMAYPSMIGLDPTGNLLIADTNNYRLRKVDSTGTITTIAGSGSYSFSGDGGPASSAGVLPQAVAADSSGNVYIVDNLRIRKIDRSGTISTIAGNGQASLPASSGDGGPALLGTLSGPSNSVVDAVGNLLIADTGNLRVRKVDASGTLSTVAGGGTYPAIGDGIAATSAYIDPYGVAVDAAGSIYIADAATPRVRKVDPNTGIITTVAGDGTYGFSGDGGPATNAAIGNPFGVTIDSSGQIYISAEGNFRLRLVDTRGIISTISGNGTYSYGGDGGPGTSASLSGPAGIAIDTGGALYIADQGNQLLRKLDSNGVITSVAGTGQDTFTGDAGLATHAGLANPNGVAVDQNGNVYVADQSNGRVRRIDATGVITTIAGGWPQPGVNGLATNEAIGNPQGPIAVDSLGNRYFASGAIPVVFRLDPAGSLSVIAGNGISGYSGDGGLATAAGFSNYILGVAVDVNGILYIADSGNQRIRTVGPSGIVMTIAGNGNVGFSGDGGPATNAMFSYPLSPAVDSVGNVYIVDAGNYRVRKISTSGVITTVAGNGLHGFSGDGGAATAATLNSPLSCAVDLNGVLYIADSGNYRVREVDPLGTISTVAGTGSPNSNGDGGAATAAAVYPYQVAVDSVGNLFIDDAAFQLVRRVDGTGTISTFAGGNGYGFSGDSGPATAATLAAPNGLGIGPDGTVYIADSNNARLRGVDLGGIITTVAGNGNVAFGGDGGPATAATLNQPISLAIDAGGNLYIADQANQRIRKVDSSGMISTFAGTGQPGLSGDGGPAADASLSNPGGLQFDPNGNLYIADSGNNVIRRVDAAGVISTVAGTGTYGFAGDSGSALNATLAYPLGLAFDGSSNLYFSDSGNGRIRRIDTLGMISTVAGSGNASGLGDGGPPVSASLLNPNGVAVDSIGTIYVADAGNGRVRRVKGVGSAVDSTPPSIVGNVAGSIGPGGWYRSAVSVSWTVTDAESPIRSQNGCQTQAVTTDTPLSGVTFTCTATSNGGTSSKSVTVLRDSVPPTATATLSPPANAAGWNKSDVIAHFNAVDALSGPGPCTADVVISTEGVSGTASGSCTDLAGNTSPVITVSGIKLDKTPPTVNLASPANGATFFVNAAVTSGYSCSDALSGIASCAGPVPTTSLVDTGTPGNKTFAVTATDIAGNTTTTTNTYTVSADSTPPVITPSVTGALGQNGWYRSNVSVSWSVVDPQSVISSQTGCGTQTITADTPSSGVIFTCSATSSGGTSSQSVTVHRDTGAPTATISSPVNGATYTQGSTVSAAYSCVDAVSGIASCAGTVAVGSAISTASPGTQTFVVAATDAAGNTSTATASYIVAAANAPPGITPIVSGTLGLNGWYTSNVSLSWTIVSSTKISSQSGCNARTVTTNTKGTTYTCTAKNVGGTTTQSVTIKRDASLPIAKATVTPSANSAGWRKTPVTATFTGSDSTSGPVACTPVDTISTEGSAQTASGQCTNNAGLVSAPVTVTGINIDLTAPTVAIAVPASGGVYVFRSAIAANYTCADALSGIATCTGSAPNGANINTSSRGVKSFTVTGLDRAGNSTRVVQTYTVQ